MSLCLCGPQLLAHMSFRHLGGLLQDFIQLLTGQNNRTVLGSCVTVSGSICLNVAHHSSNTLAIAKEAATPCSTASPQPLSCPWNFYFFWRRRKELESSPNSKSSLTKIYALCLLQNSKATNLFVPFLFAFLLLQSYPGMPLLS